MRGCFVGSENPKVVEALRAVYVDFPPLQLSGDWICKVVSSIMGRRSKNKKYIVNIELVSCSFNNPQIYSSLLGNLLHTVVWSRILTS